MPFFDINGDAIYAAKAGASLPVVILVHGAGSNHTVWGRALEALRARATVVAVDLNGHGRSPVRPGEGLVPYLNEVLAVAEALQRPFVVVGHSMGGALALQVGLANPEGLVGIGVVGSGARLRVLPALLTLLEDDFDGAVDFLLGLMFHRSLPEVVKQTRLQLLNTEQTVVMRDFQACDRFDVSAELDKIRVPAWVCVGRYDQLTPVKYATYLNERLPHATLDIIEGSGHMPMLERPHALNAALGAFLSQLTV